MVPLDCHLKKNNVSPKAKLRTNKNNVEIAIKIVTTLKYCRASFLVGQTTCSNSASASRTKAIGHLIKTKISIKTLQLYKKQAGVKNNILREEKMYNFSDLDRINIYSISCMQKHTDIRSAELFSQ